MKFLAFILSIYVLLLAGIPCCTFDRCSSDESAAVGVGNANVPVQDNTAPDEPQPEGACSPFFSCHNCSVPAVLVKPLLVELISSTNQTRYFDFQPSSLQSYNALCWNPPKA